MSFLVSFFVDWGAGDVFFPNEDSDSDMDADRDTDTDTDTDSDADTKIQTQTLELSQKKRSASEISIIKKRWNCPRRGDRILNLYQKKTMKLSQDNQDRRPIRIGV